VNFLGAYYRLMPFCLILGVKRNARSKIFCGQMLNYGRVILRSKPAVNKP
jgi:hypothetical protein